MITMPKSINEYKEQYFNSHGKRYNYSKEYIHKDSVWHDHPWSVKRHLILASVKSPVCTRREAILAQRARNK